MIAFRVILLLTRVNVSSSSPSIESERNAELLRELTWANLKIQRLEEILRLERIKKYGPASEKLSDAQLDLLDQEPGVSGAEVQAESAREPLAPPRNRRRRSGRRGNIRDGRNCPPTCRAWNA